MKSAECTVMFRQPSKPCAWQLSAWHSAVPRARQAACQHVWDPQPDHALTCTSSGSASSSGLSLDAP